MTNYYVDFTNKTPQTWSMSVYQTLPDSIGLDSVSWKQTRVPTGGTSGVSWNVQYNVALAEYKQIGGIGVYKSNQLLEAALGSVWDIVFEDEVQQLKFSSASGTPGQILIRNESNLTANAGIGMSGAGSVFKKNVLGGASAQFLVTPTYYVGIFNQLELGEVISSNVIVEPLEIKYPSGMNKATLTAYLDGQNIKLDLAYTNSISVAAHVVKRFIEMQPARPAELAL
ncbi:MAG: hypothetical protein JO270_13700 [Acidobacteriaceae bacterium]|nr:hypothetical protein [Acidobacteriaceae bacterium]